MLHREVTDAALCDALPAGSCLVLSHATGDLADRNAAQAVCSRATAALDLRSRAAVERFFDGLELVEPGLAQTPFRRDRQLRWRGPQDALGNHQVSSPRP